MIASQRGVALITVLFLLAIFTVLLASSFSLAHTEISTSKNAERAVQVLAQAEAGIDYAVARLRAGDFSSPTTTVTLPDIVGNSGSTTIAVVKTSTLATITSVSLIPGLGDLPSASRAITAKVLLPGDGEGSPIQIPAFWKRPVTANGTIHWNGNNADIDASGLSGPAIQSNSTSANPSVSFNGNHFNINGANPDIGYMQGSGVSVPWGSTVISEVVPPDSVLTMDMSYWANVAKPSDSAQIPSDYFSTHTTITGPAWVDGNLTIGTNNATVYGPLYVNGDIQISANNVNINGIIFAKGTISISCNNLREPTGSSIGITFVAAKKSDGSGGSINEGANNITVNGVNGFGLVAEQDVSINTNNFTLTGLAYAGRNMSLPSNNFDLTGALVARGNISIADNNFRVAWKDFSGAGSGQAPPGMIGAGGAAGDFSLIFWSDAATP